MSITADTRFESYGKLDKTRLYNLIINTLLENQNKGLTAREVSIDLYNKGLIYSNERQATAPRLTEMVDNGMVKVIGKRLDNITRRNVAVYAVNA